MTARLSLVLTSALFAGSATAQTPAGPQDAARATERTSVPFEFLDNDEGAWIDMVLTPVRPLAFHPTNGHLFSVNSHDSTLVEFDASGATVATTRVPWGPVSVAYWEAASARDDRILVVCRGTYTLAQVDPTSGAIENLLELPTEPADILVHPQSNHVFVSCSGDDSVVEIDVEQNVVLRRYLVPSKRPTFMTYEGGDILIAPMISGNNSIAQTGSQILDVGPEGMMDLEDPLVAQQGLADHDLFRITPGVNQVLPIARDMGTILFDVGVHPTTGDIWQLGTEANNKDETRVGEPAIRGEFVFNRIALAVPQSGQTGAIEPFLTIELDDADPGTAGIQYDPTRTVGQPYALDFDAAGNGYVTGLLTDNVTQYSAAGAFVREWNVGSIPRGIEVSAAGDRAWVYLWGDNTVELYDLLPGTPQLLSTLDLGFDPTPELHKEGRRLFFSAAFSMHNNSSCASCHVETESDMLAWDLSDLPFDDKGPLITQTMRGIADLSPFHWRGERAGLVDFNGAFDGLLGGVPLDETPGGAFEAFEAYLFSTQQPANPNEDPRRVVSSTRGFTGPDGTRHVANAVRGQDLFINRNVIAGVGSCATCHTLPTGTSNEVVLDEPELEAHPRRTHFKVAPFNGVWRKEQRTLETIVFADGTSEERPTLGSGTSATGLKSSMLDFVEIDQFGLAPQQEKDIAAFVDQIDSGIAPAVHKSYLLRQGAPTDSFNKVRGYMLDQASARNIDIAIFGSVDFGQGPIELRWAYDRNTGLFASEDSSLPQRPMEFFVQQAVSGLGHNTVIGLPVGMAERFAIDFDADDLFNADEALAGTDPLSPDSDLDGDADGLEAKNGGDPTDDQVGANDVTAPTVENLRLIYVTTKAAKLAFDTAEPTRFDANWVINSFSGSASSTLYEKTHMILLSDLRPNRLHPVVIDVIDQAGNVTTTQLDVQTPSLVQTGSLRFNVPNITVLENSGGTLRFTLSGRARLEGGGLQAGIQLRVQVFVNGVETQPLLTGTTSGGNGITSVEVVETGLSVGDEVHVSVFTLFNVGLNSGVFWSMPETAPSAREFVQVYDGTGP